MSKERRALNRIPKELPEELISRVAEKSFEASLMLANESLGALTHDLPVERFMSRDLTNARPTDTAAELRACMQQHGFRHMLVCEPDADGVERLRGVVSDRDLANRDNEPAAKFMAQKPDTVCPETGMMHAATVMLNRRISCLPVVHSEELDRVLGILTLTDLLLGLNCLLPVIEGIAEQLAAIERSEAGERATAATDKAAQLVRELRG